MRLPYGLRALRHRVYRLFWFGQLVSRIGTWMQRVAQAWLVLELTNSPLRLGLISTLQFSPVLLFAFLGGVISDRVRKKRLIMATQVAMMFQAFALSALVWSGHVQYWHVAVLAALYGVANAMDMPARQSYVVELTGKNDLMSAIALNSAIFNSARVIGPAIAGMFIARYGTGLAFFVNAVSFIAVLIALWAMRTEGEPHPREATTIRQEFVQSVTYAARMPRIRFALGTLLFVSLFVLNFNVVVPLIARDVLGQGAHGFGFLMAALGIGAVLGALGVASANLSRPSMRVIVAGAAIVSAGVFTLALVKSFALAASVLLVSGMAQIAFTSSVNSMLQVSVPDAMRGRVMSLYVLVFVGVTPAGAFLIGTLAEAFGVQTACAVGGGFGLLSVVVLGAVQTRATVRSPQ